MNNSATEYTELENKINALRENIKTLKECIRLLISNYGINTELINKKLINLP